MVAMQKWMWRCVCAFTVSVVGGGETTRIWTSRSGSTFQGVLIRPGHDSVTLRSVDGREMKVPMAALSDADQAYVSAGWMKSDRYAMRRRIMADPAADSGEVRGAMFKEGPWKGAMFVHDHSIYVMNGALEGVLYPSTSGPKAVEAPIEAMNPLFSCRNPKAGDREGRGWRPLSFTGVQSNATLPVVPEPSVKGTAEVGFQVTRSNGKVCSLKYPFSGDTIQVSLRYPDFETDEEISRVRLANEFPAVPELSPDWDPEKNKSEVEGWRIDWKDAVRGAEGNGGISWWQPGNSISCREVRMEGPWEPWTFTFSTKDKGDAPVVLGLYPSMAPYRHAFGVSRYASQVEGDLVIDWGFRLEK